MDRLVTKPDISYDSLKKYLQPTYDDNVVDRLHYAVSVGINVIVAAVISTYYLAGIAETG